MKTLATVIGAIFLIGLAAMVFLYLIGVAAAIFCAIKARRSCITDMQKAEFDQIGYTLVAASWFGALAYSMFYENTDKGK